MDRRHFLFAAGALTVAPATRSLRAFAPAVRAASKPEHTLRITPASLEVARGRVVKTTGYNGGVPGPLIRLKQGVPVTMDLVNETSAPEFVHFHGLATSIVVDGAEEEGSPVLAAGATRRISFTPHQAGNRWYHTHSMAMADVTRGAYSGQYGFLYVEPKNDPGRFDQEVFLAARHWEPTIVHRGDPNNDWTVTYGISSLGERALGHGEPIRVKEGQRVLFHLLNASATRQVTLALPGHRFQVIALDGNPVPRPQSVDAVQLAVAERADVIVEMNQPGVWIMGAPRDQDRADGMGVVIEYAGRTGEPQWKAITPPAWDYSQFAAAGSSSSPAAVEPVVELEFHMMADEGTAFNRWMVNGKLFPHTDPIRVKRGKRYRLALHNGHEDGHPIHLHRHLFEVVRIGDKPVSGLVKDTVNVPRDQTVEVDFVADNPGPSLLHCHMQHHMDYGFKTLIEYV
jgi:FtsP/CotA-like multicopper oxidase with cupredoxin domain